MEPTTTLNDVLSSYGGGTPRQEKREPDTSGLPPSSSSKDKPVIQTSAIIDLLYISKGKPYICATGQSFPFFDIRNGYCWDVRAYLYSALRWKESYYTDLDGECLTEGGLCVSGREDAILGYGYGLRELLFRNSPPGTFCVQGIDTCVPGLRDHPLRVLDFSKIARSADSAYEKCTDIIPSIYYEKAKGSADLPGDCYMWTPDRGTRVMGKAPIPFLVTPFDQLLPLWGYSIEHIRNFASLYKGMVSEWCYKNDVDRLYIGHTEQGTGVDHLLSPDEYLTNANRRTIKSTPYIYPDIWKGIDVNRTRLRMILHNQTFDTPELYTAW